MKTLNLTIHPATPDQIAAGVVELSDAQDRKTVTDWLTFNHAPHPEETQLAAMKIAVIAFEATDAERAMIGGALWLMGPLEKALRLVGIEPVYAFSIRTSVEETMPDGSVVKKNVFKHLDFVRGATT